MMIKYCKDDDNVVKMINSDENKTKKKLISMFTCNCYSILIWLGVYKSNLLFY